MATAIKGHIYKHFKTGDLYIVRGIARHTERDERLVLYECLSNRHQILWARPLEMFEEFVEKDGEQVERFEHVGFLP